MDKSKLPELTEEELRRQWYRNTIMLMAQVIWERKHPPAANAQPNQLIIEEYARAF